MNLDKFPGLLSSYHKKGRSFYFEFVLRCFRIHHFSCSFDDLVFFLVQSFSEIYFSRIFRVVHEIRQLVSSLKSIVLAASSIFFVIEESQNFQIFERTLFHFYRTPKCSTISVIAFSLQSYVCSVHLFINILIQL